MSTETPEKATPAEAVAPEAPAEAPQLKVTGASDFRKRRDERHKTETLELPSGVIVELRRPQIDKLIRQGHIPADVAVSVQRLQGQDSSTLKGKELKDYFEVIDLITEHAFVNPKVKKGELSDADYDNGFISIEDVEENDKVFIMHYVQSGLKDLSKFRPKS